MKGMAVRPVARDDRRPIEELLGRSPEFTREEVACALELMDEVLAQGQSEDDYIILCAESSGGEIIGFACYGKTPLTRGTYDLYWIAADPRHRRGGVGTQLLRRVEEHLAKQGVRILVAETSSLPAYAQARSFYCKEGFHEESRIRGFYAPGDDRLIYCKRF